MGLGRLQGDRCGGEKILGGKNFGQGIRGTPKKN